MRPYSNQQSNHPRIRPQSLGNLQNVPVMRVVHPSQPQTMCTMPTRLGSVSTVASMTTPSRIVSTPPRPFMPSQRGSMPRPPIPVTQFDVSKMKSAKQVTPLGVTPLKLDQDLTAIHAGIIDPRIKAMPKKKCEDKEPELYPGGFTCGIARNGDELIIKGPSKDILKFKTHIGTREGTTFLEDDLASDRIIALDFDQTLANIFLWAELGGLHGADMQERNLHKWAQDGRLLKAFGGKERLVDIRMALHARKSRGDLIVVLSSGYAQVIRPALEYMGLEKLIPKELVYGSDTWPFGISKSARLAQLKKLHNRTKATLVDDDVGYCRVCLKEGHDVIWVRNQSGMQKHELGLLTHGEWQDHEDLRFDGGQPTMKVESAPILASHARTPISCQMSANTMTPGQSMTTIRQLR